jgi:hypothetical protein
MSMMAELLHVSPRVLDLVRKDPGLVHAVRQAGAPAFPEFEGLPIPANVFKILRMLPPEERARVVSGMAEDLADLKEELDASPLAGGRRSVEEGRAQLALRGVAPAEMGEALGIAQAWHGLHFLLTGSAIGGEPPLADAVVGGREVGEDLGYGPLRILEPDEAAAVAGALDDLDRADLARRYDPPVMEEMRLYPGGWDEPENREWLLDAFDELKAYYGKARDQGHGMLLFLV